jgi:hypothetical protein
MARRVPASGHLAGAVSQGSGIGRLGHGRRPVHQLEDARGRCQCTLHAVGCATDLPKRGVHPREGRSNGEEVSRGDFAADRQGAAHEQSRGDPEKRDDLQGRSRGRFQTDQAPEGGQEAVLHGTVARPLRLLRPVGLHHANATERHPSKNGPQPPWASILTEW